MATMDLVKYYGGEPANFLDIGGSSNPEKVVNALRIITGDPSVKAILFNIFGGITRTDDVANGIVTATSQFKVKVPIVIRLTGTNESRSGQDPPGHRHDGAVRHGRGGPAGGRAGQGGRVSIFVNKDTRLVVQGITGRDGSFHAKQMMEYGTKVVAGVTPGKGGQTFEGTVPVFNTVAEAVPRPAPTPRSSTCRRSGPPGAIYRGGRCRHRPDRLHHRGRAGHGHDPGHALRAGEGAPG